MPGQSPVDRELVRLDPEYVGHRQGHPGQWGWERSRQTAEGLGRLTLAFNLRQQITLADFEMGGFPRQMLAGWGEMGDKKTSSQEGGGRRGRQWCWRGRTA